MNEETQPPDSPGPEGTPPIEPGEPTPTADQEPSLTPPSADGESASGEPAPDEGDGEEPEEEPLAVGEGVPTAPSWFAPVILAMVLMTGVVILAALIAAGAFSSSSSDNGSTTPSPAPTTPAPTAPPVAGQPTTLADGLQIITIKDGTGAAPQLHEVVTVNYTGYLQGGGEFDSSLNQGRSPFSFALGEGNVIPGWDEGIPLMKIGGSYRLIIPPELGYGEAGSPPVIPANATLVFDIDVLSSNTPTPSPTPFATINSTPPPAASQPTTLADGLQVITLQEGTGATPQTHDTVTLDYTGWVQGGGEFGTSIGDTPVTFVLGEGYAIPGIDEGVAQMKVGGKYRLILPPELAYGEEGAPPAIGPNATLIFDISITDSQTPTPTPQATPTPTPSS